ESGQVGGLFHPVTETTATMLAERRTRALRDLAASLSAAADEQNVARRTVELLSRFEFDLPFLLYYAFDPKEAQYRLAAHHGIAPEERSMPLTIARDAAFPWPLADVLSSSGSVRIDHLPSMLAGMACGPYEEPPSTAFAIPIVVPAAEQTPAVIVV